MYTVEEYEGLDVATGANLMLVVYTIMLHVMLTYSLLWSNIKVPTGVVNPVQLTTTRVILISPRKWSGLGQYQYQTLILL